LYRKSLHCQKILERSRLLLVAFFILSFTRMFYGF